MDFRIFLATIRKNTIINFRAYPISFFVGELMAGIFHISISYFLYHYFFKGQLDPSFAKYTGVSDYMTYIIIGSATYQFVVRTCLNVSRSLITELRMGTLESIMIAPFHRVSYFLGNMTHQTLFTALETSLLLLISIPFGVKVHQLNIFSTIMAVVISLYAFLGLSLILATVMLYFRDTYITQNTLFAFLFLLCGIQYPTEYLPVILQKVAYIIPVTTALKVIRNSSMVGMSIYQQLNDFIYLAFIATVYVIIGFWLLKIVEKIALEKTYG